MPEISKTADLGLSLLVALRERGPMTASELSKTLTLNRTVVHRLLTTLRQRSFVIREGSSYALGPTIVRLAEGVQPKLRVAASEAMTSLSRESGETVVLHIAEDLEAVVLHQVLGTSHIVRVEHQIGLRHPLTVGASGRAILPFLPSEVVDDLLEARGDAAELRTQIGDVRRLGYAMSHDELQLGVAGVATAVLDGDGIPVGSIAVVVPSGRSQTLSDHADAVVAAARRASDAYAEADSRAVMASPDPVA